MAHYQSSFLRILFVAILLQVAVLSAFGQDIRQYKGFKQTAGVVDIQVSDGIYRLEPYNLQIVHTNFIPNGETNAGFNYAVSAKPAQITVNVSESKSGLIITVGLMEIQVTKSPFAIAYNYNQQLLLTDNRGYFVDDTLKAIGLTIDDNELLYGGGERVLGLNRRGHKLTLYNKAHYGYGTYSELMNYTLPLVMSSKKYAVLFDNPAMGFLDLDSKKNNQLIYSAVSGLMNYYVVAGSSWLNLIEQYTWLTGRQPMPPMWAFGNFSSRFGYHSQREVMQTVQKFKSDGIPVDAVIIDIYWFGPGIFGAMGNLDWYLDSFPEPQKMIASLKQMGVKTVLVTEPFILTTSNRWTEAVNSQAICNGPDGKPYTYNFYFGNTGLIDIFKPEARQWFWDIYKKFTNQGVAGWWGDLGEPELHPYPVQHVNGAANDVHNAYGHSWAQLIYEGYQTDFPQQRPFILMRSGYAGSQRYGIIPWTGDVSRGWDGLVSQPELALSMAMQGVAYTHSDLGGFAGGDSLDNELYARWLQYGVFQPVYRPHAQEQIPSEPVFQKPETKKLAKEAIELRYKLLPYIYSLAFENHQSGKPMMMPLFFVEPDNQKLATYDKTYLWGDNFLVHPVKERGLKTSVIYFPEGNNWIDFYTDKMFAGGSETRYELKSNYIPVFVKQGAVVPMIPVVENTTKYSPENIELHYWYGQAPVTSKFNLYLDDGITPDAYEKGIAEVVAISAASDGASIKLSLDRTTGTRATVKLTQTKLVVHGLEGEPVSVNSANQALAGATKWLPEKGIYVIKLAVEQEHEELTIKLK